MPLFCNQAVTTSTLEQRIFFDRGRGVRFTVIYRIQEFEEMAKRFIFTSRVTGF